MNVFDRDNYPEDEPKELRPGEFWAWKKSDLGEIYDPLLFSLGYTFRSLEGSGHFDVPMTYDAGVYYVEATPEDTAQGAYKWALRVTQISSGNVATLSAGYATIHPHASEEQRSHTLRVLQAIRATIEKTASKEQANYSIAGRALSRRSPEELMALEREYAARWENEKKALDRRHGRKSKNRQILVSF